MVFLFREPESYVPLIEFDGSWPDIHLENDVFSIDHTMLGEAVAKKWHFPEEVTMIIRNHHAPVNRTSALVCLINNIICGKDLDDKTAEIPCSRLMERYLGDAHKDLVNTILQRYKINKIIIENLF